VCIEVVGEAGGTIRHSELEEPAIIQATTPMNISNSTTAPIIITISVIINKTTTTRSRHHPHLLTLLLGPEHLLEGVGNMTCMTSTVHLRLTPTITKVPTAMREEIGMSKFESESIGRNSLFSYD
jgi:hypothetical protein